MLDKIEMDCERYEARLKGLRDRSSSLFGAREMGKFMGRIHICQLILMQPQTPEEELEKLSLEELSRLAYQLWRRVSSPGAREQIARWIAADQSSASTHLP